MTTKNIFADMLDHVRRVNDDLIAARPSRNHRAERLDAHLTTAGQEQQRHEGHPAVHGSTFSRVRASDIPPVTTFHLWAL